MRYLIVLILMPLIQMGISFIGTELLSLNNSFRNVYGLVFAQQFFAVFLPTYLLFHKKKYLPKKECIGINFSDVSRFIAIGVSLQFVGVAVNLPVSVMLQKMGYSLPKGLPMAKTPIQFFAQTVIVCLTPAIFEEVCFRRMIFSEIRKKSAVAAVLFSALFFAMAHMDFYNFPATFLIGCCFGIARTRNVPLILLIIAHFFVNLSASVLNHLLINPAISGLIQRYFLLWIFLALVILVTIFPKKKENSTPSLKLSKSFFRYLISLLKNPLFYGYCILFVVLGVRQL